METLESRIRIHLKSWECVPGVLERDPSLVLLQEALDTITDLKADALLEAMIARDQQTDWVAFAKDFIAGDLEKHLPQTTGPWLRKRDSPGRFVRNN